MLQILSVSYQVGQWCGLPQDEEKLPEVSLDDWNHILLKDLILIRLNANISPTYSLNDVDDGLDLDVTDLLKDTDGSCPEEYFGVSKSPLVIEGLMLFQDSLCS